MNADFKRQLDLAMLTATSTLDPAFCQCVIALCLRGILAELEEFNAREETERNR